MGMRRRKGASTSVQRCEDLPTHVLVPIKRETHTPDLYFTLIKALCLPANVVVRSKGWGQKISLLSQDGLLAALPSRNLRCKVLAQLHDIAHKDCHRHLADGWHEANTLHAG